MTLHDARIAVIDAQNEGLLGKYPQAAITLEARLEKMRKVADMLFDAAAHMYPHASYGRAAMRDAMDEYDRVVREDM